MFIDTHKGQAWGSDKALSDAAALVAKFKAANGRAQSFRFWGYALSLSPLVGIPLVYLAGNANWSAVASLFTGVVLLGVAILWFTRPSRPQVAQYNNAVATIDVALQEGRALLLSSRAWRLLSGELYRIADLTLRPESSASKESRAREEIIRHYATAVAVAIKAAREQGKTEDDIHAKIADIATGAAVALAQAYNAAHHIEILPYLPDPDAEQL